MSESLYMTEIELLLEKVSKMACSDFSDRTLEVMMEDTKRKLIRYYGFNPDDAEREVRAAAGLEP